MRFVNAERNDKGSGSGGWEKKAALSGDFHSFCSVLLIVAADYKFISIPQKPRTGSLSLSPECENSCGHSGRKKERANPSEDHG